MSIVVLGGRRKEPGKVRWSLKRQTMKNTLDCMEMSSRVESH